MIENLVFIFLILAFIIASYEDIKKREVYDYLNFFLVFLVITFALFNSLILNSFDPIKYVGFGLILGFLIGSILFYMGIWGGGDAKFLIGFCGSVYYIKDFAKETFGFNNIFNYILSKISEFFVIFLETFLGFILILDVISILLIFSMFFTKDLKKEDRKNLIYLLLIFVSLFIGLYFKYESIILILLGIFAFILIFFAGDNVFNSVYLKISKNVKYLKEYDIINKEIKYNTEVIVSREDCIAGLNKENLIQIHEKVDKNTNVDVRKILPYSILIGLNYLIYVINIITLDTINLEILSFVIEFMFFSFLAGGIISLLLIFYFYLKNYHKCGNIFSKTQKAILYIFSTLTIMISIIFPKLIFLIFVPFLYVLLKIAKKVEKHMFVTKKDLDKIVPGDWIVEDIEVDGKKIYTIDNFKLGISEEQIKRIKELAIKHSNLNSIYVKDGIAFLPPLFIGFILILLL